MSSASKDFIAFVIEKLTCNCYVERTDSIVITGILEEIGDGGDPNGEQSVGLIGNEGQGAGTRVICRLRWDPGNNGHRSSWRNVASHRSWTTGDDRTGGVTYEVKIQR